MANWTAPEVDLRQWVEVWATPLLLLCVRFSWIWPSLEIGRRWLTPSYAQPWLPWWAVAGLMLGALVTARVALAVGERLVAARVMAAVAGLLAVLVVIWSQYAAATYGLLDRAWLQMLGEQLAGWQGELPAPALATVVAVLLWLRGLLDASRALAHERIWATFMVGFLVFSGLLLIGYYAPSGIPPGMETWLLLLFGAGMGALALSSMEMANYGRKPQGGARLRIDRYWLGGVAAVVGGLLGIGLLVSALVSPALVARLLSWVGVLLQYVGMVLGFVLFMLAYAVFRVLTPLIEWMQDRFAMADLTQVTPDMQEAAEQFQEGDSSAIIALAPQYEALLRWLGGIGVVLLVALIFALALRRTRSRQEDSVEEIRESVFSRDLMAEQLGRLRRMLWPRRRQTTEESPYLSLEGESVGRRAVRAMYQRLLTSARTIGLPRAPVQTPDEYATTLVDRLASIEPHAPDNAGIDRLTALYDAVRYGDAEPDGQEVAAVEAALAVAEARLLGHGQGDGGQE